MTDAALPISDEDRLKRNKRVAYYCIAFIAFMVGAAYAPGGRPIDVLRVAFHVGRVSKVLAVIGDREWRTGFLSNTMGPIKPFDRMEDDPATPADEAHMFEPHYDLHVWLYRDNPNGLFAQFNPKVSCAHGTTHMAGHTQHGGGK